MFLAALKSSLRCTILAGVGRRLRWLAGRDQSRLSMASSEITLEAIPDIGDIPAADWDACANPRPDPDSLETLDTLASSAPAEDCRTASMPAYNPFVSHAFFAAAEASGSA